MRNPKLSRKSEILKYKIFKNKIIFILFYFFNKLKTIFEILIYNKYYLIFLIKY
jgi:hypothetical protein